MTYLKFVCNNYQRLLPLYILRNENKKLFARVFDPIRLYAHVFDVNRSSCEITSHPYNY